jgi:DNA-directed RNA polymerase specialized sigma24 family protein
MTPFLGHSARSARALDRLYRRHVGDVYRYSLAVLDDSADAEAVTRATFLNAQRALERGERPAKPENWLLGIAHSVCGHRARQLDDAGEERDLDEPDSRAEDVQRALGHLAFHERAALLMRELEGRSHPEIAGLLERFRAPEGSLTCDGAELAVSRHLDGRLERAEKRALRSHLRQCDDCIAFAYQQQAQRKALRALADVPVPASLSGAFAGH